jgi:hypothetical protein
MREHQQEPSGRGIVQVNGTIFRAHAMNDRRWEISAYAALACSFVAAVVAAVMIIDRIAYAI